MSKWSFPTGDLMKGKRGLVMGVANDSSIAWGIAQQLAAQGAEIAFTYQGENLERRVRPLVESIGMNTMIPADVTDDASMDAAFAQVKEKWGKIDFLVHSIAFAGKEELMGSMVANTSREGFRRAMDISVYSFIDCARRASEIMPDGGSIVCMTYLGAERTVPSYNVMGVAKAALEASVRYMATDLGEAGIRVNAISAGPIKTLAASGIGDFRYILKWNQYNSPLRRNVTIEEVGGAGLYLLSDLSAGVTGEVHHVDSGYHIVGMKNPDAPDISTV